MDKVVESNDTNNAEKSFFSEKNEVIELINYLISCQFGNFEDLTQLDKLKRILDAYQEQPQLLGPHVEELVLPLNQWLIQCLEAGTDEISFKKLHLICKIYYHISKVRGAKQMSKYLPHEVYQLEPCVEFLRRQVSFTESFQIDLF